MAEDAYSAPQVVAALEQVLRVDDRQVVVLRPMSGPLHGFLGVASPVVPRKFLPIGPLFLYCSAFRRSIVPDHLRQVIRKLLQKRP